MISNAEAKTLFNPVRFSTAQKSLTSQEIVIFLYVPLLKYLKVSYNALHGTKHFPLASSWQSLCALKHEIQLPISLSWTTKLQPLLMIRELPTSLI